eukprot:12440679-Alexandrium_andersonii.AAC.1
MAPPGLPETDVAARPFNGFRETRGLLQRLSQEPAQRAQDQANCVWRYRSLGQRKVVFQKHSGPARLPKRLFP